MQTIKMTLTGANVKETRDGARKYLALRFKGDFDGELSASMNIDATDENAKRVEKFLNQTFDIAIDTDEIMTGTYNGKPYRATKVANKSDVKSAMGFPKKSLSEALIDQINN